MNRNAQSKPGVAEEKSKKSEAEIFFTLYHKHCDKGLQPTIDLNKLKSGDADVCPGTPPGVIETRKELYRYHST